MTMEEEAKERAASVHPGAAAVFESVSPLPLPILQDSHHCRGAVCDRQSLVQPPGEVRQCHGHLGRGELR